MSQQTTSKPWYKKWWAITLFIFLGLIAIGSLANYNNSTNQQSTPALQQEDNSEVNNNQITQETPTDTNNINNQLGETESPEINSKLTHDELFIISNKDGNSIIGKSYQMTLFLEQHQTSTQAEFMSQPDDNSMDTILITCNMKSNELDRLDGESAQKRIYKPYDLQLTFTKYDAKVGLYYEADCSLK